ncbi:MAG TPA: hypothetical protein VHV81_06180 [Steroidobacteraceae bacterium]|jgi:hypothetical protein|nr:hypothetical protein [Steroidobacteraceae bacterium]
MNELRQALAEIHSIRNQVARGTEFRGYGPASIAASGVLALLVAGVQAEWAVRHARLDLAQWLALWVGTAGLVIVATGTETFRRALRVHRGLALEMVQSAVEQFLPALTVGVLLTVVMVRMAPAEYWMLPGLWQLVFSLGVFASCRFLPRPMIAVGIWYLAAGLYCLAAASQSHGVSPWMMGIPFGVGQLLVACVLQRRYEQTRELGAGDARE